MAKHLCAQLIWRQASSAVHIKSILKPTVPLTPLKPIPTFDETRKRSSGRSGKKSPRHDDREDLLIDFSTPAPSYATTAVTGAEHFQDPFSPFENTAGQGRGKPYMLPGGIDEPVPRLAEVEEPKTMQMQATLDQETAQSKSLKSRRVSFAKEATLHTWKVVEMMEDSTTSSTSNSTRRRSSMKPAPTTNKLDQYQPEFDQSEPPSTPPEQVKEPIAKTPPARDQGLRQQSRRDARSEVSYAPERADRNESSPTSTYSGSSGAGESSPVHVEDSINSSLDEDGDTTMSLDDATGQTVRSELSNSSTGSSLEGRLRRAAAEAGTLGIEYDENGDDLSMELAEGTITNAFQPWVNRPPRAPAQDNSAMQDQENINPFSPAFKSQADVTIEAAEAAGQDDTQDGTMDVTVEATGQDDTQDVSMDMTIAAGIILPKNSPPSKVEKISLQEFLNMTNIHFMELSTTKRRHTQAPSSPARPSHEGSPSSSGTCFAAAATTLPLLELYQHATRELKSYILTGRKVIRSIEQETLEEQPALFQEYVDARPDLKTVMDNQFRNGKAHARLRSKEGWYAWRRQLVEGLRGGLEGIKAGMEEDAKSLKRHEAVLEGIVPDLVKQLGELEQEARKLQQRAEDFASIDHDSLNIARSQLESADHEVAQKIIQLGQLEQQIAGKVEELSAANELKTEFQDQIAEAERVQDECRGWKAEDVRSLQERVQVIEKISGWTLVTAEHEVGKDGVDFGPALTMRYRDGLRLFFYPAAFQQGSSEQNGQRRSRRTKSNSGPSTPISLTYAPVRHDAATSADLTTQQRFFLQILQGQMHALAVLPSCSVSPKALLTLVSEGWDLATKVSEEIRLLEIAGITKVSILSDDKLEARCMTMLPGLCRVDVQFTLAVTAANGVSILTSVVVDAMPKYGSVATYLTGGKALKIREALNKQATSKEIGEGAWVAAVRGLEEWFNLQKETKKGHQGANKPAAEPTPVTVPVPIPVPTAPEIVTPVRAPSVQKKELKRPVPMEEVMEEAAARQEELRRQEEEELLLSATKTPAAHGRRPGALRRS